MVKNLCCALCGDIKYIPSRSKKLNYNRKPMSHLPTPPERQEWAEGCSVGKASRLVFRFEKSPKVKLCDVTRVFGMISHNFSCVLPPILQRKRKCKRVRCFKKEFRSLTRRSGRWVVSQTRKVCTPTNGCASVSSGEVTEPLDGASRALAERIPVKINRGLASRDDSICDPSISRQVCSQEETCGYGERGSLAASANLDKTETPELTIPIMILQRIPASNASASTQPYQHGYNSFVVCKKKMSPSFLLETGSGEDSEEVSFTSDVCSCQRTRVYVPCPRLSCARTDQPWPFPRHGPPQEMKLPARTGPRWISALEGSECKIDTSDASQRNLQSCLRKFVEEGTKKLFLSKGTGVENLSRQSQATEIEQDIPSVVKGPKNLDNQKVPSNANDECQHFLKLPTDLEQASFFQNESFTFGAVEKNHLADENNNSPVTFRQDQISTPSANCIVTKSGNVSIMLPDSSSRRGRDRTPSPVGTPNLKSSLTVRVETSHTPPSLHPDLCITPDAIYPRDQKHPSSPVLEASKMESHPDSSVTVLSVKDQHPTAALDTTLNYNRDVWSPKSSTSVLPSARSVEEETRMTQVDSQSVEDTSPPSSASSTDELRSPSHVSSSEEDDPEPSKVSEVIEAPQIPTSSFLPERPAEVGCDLDVMRAYAEDAIVLDVIQDDPDLFGALVTENAHRPSSEKDSVGAQKDNKESTGPKKRTPARVRTRSFWKYGSPSISDLATSDVQFDDEFHQDAKNGHCSRSWSPIYSQVETEQVRGRLWSWSCDGIGSVIDGSNYQDKRANAKVNPAKAQNLGSRFQAEMPMHTVCAVGGRDGRPLRPQSASPCKYCWYYFSEHHSCMYQHCQYLHVPVDKDEKFCMEMVQKFCRVGSPHIVCRAVEVFVGYYSRSAPGLSFNQNTVNLLLSTLLSLEQLRGLKSVINTLLTHKKTPSTEFLMTFYDHVRMRGLIRSVPELVHLTSKMVEAGCVFTVDQFEAMQADLRKLQVPRLQMDAFHTVKCRALVVHPHTAAIPELTRAVMQVELCRKHENWAGLARVFERVCNGLHSLAELSRFCCCVTTALLQEPKDRLTLPYEPFAESVCQEVPLSGLVRSFLGQVGISLMFKYHNAQEWLKGVKLVNTMSRLNLEFSTLKSYFGSKESVSRCRLTTTATELFLHSGSIEGALNVLRADEWFVSSSMWPCKAEDMDNRRHVLLLLAGKTSFRDTLEVLSNLPGLSEPLDGIKTSEYGGVFNAHLQRCLNSQVLQLAADTLEFMLTRRMAAETTQLHNLIYKLGKQNSWSRARSLFKCARLAGYYSEVMCNTDSLALPSGLSEIEMTLAFEMFIACSRTSLQNPSDPNQPLIITLRRNSPGGEAVMESDYLASGSCLLSAALISNPKLTVHYSTVSQNQEQIFHMDRKSATKWLTYNSSWAEMWTS